MLYVLCVYVCVWKKPNKLNQFWRQTRASALTVMLSLSLSVDMLHFCTQKKTKQKQKKGRFKTTTLVALHNLPKKLNREKEKKQAHTSHEIREPTKKDEYFVKQKIYTGKLLE